MIRPTIGRKKHKLLRDVGNTGGWVNGEPVEAERKEFIIRANIQPAFQSYMTQTFLQAYREKEIIFISSKDYIYTARSGDDVELQPDIVLYNDAEWQVIWTKPYQNLGYHVECYAVKLNESTKPRINGAVFGRK